MTPPAPVPAADFHAAVMSFPYEQWIAAPDAAAHVGGSAEMRVNGATGRSWELNRLSKYRIYCGRASVVPVTTCGEPLRPPGRGVRIYCGAIALTMDRTASRSTHCPFDPYLGHTPVEDAGLPRETLRLVIRTGRRRGLLRTRREPGRLGFYVMRIAEAPRPMTMAIT